jgi:hypothetical protein
MPSVCSPSPAFATIDGSRRRCTVEFLSDEFAQRGEERLRAVCLDGRPVLTVVRNGRQIAASCIVTTVTEQYPYLECDSGYHWSREHFFEIFRATLPADLSLAS